jgi:hypothetical protein
LAREGGGLSGKNLPRYLERGVGKGECFVSERDYGTVVSDQVDPKQRWHSCDSYTCIAGGWLVGAVLANDGGKGEL